MHSSALRLLTHLYGEGVECMPACILPVARELWLLQLSQHRAEDQSAQLEGWTTALAANDGNMYGEDEEEVVKYTGKDRKRKKHLKNEQKEKESRHKSLVSCALNVCAGVPEQCTACTRDDSDTHVWWLCNDVMHSEYTAQVAQWHQVHQNFAMVSSVILEHAPASRDVLAQIMRCTFTPCLCFPRSGPAWIAQVYVQTLNGAAAGMQHEGSPLPGNVDPALPLPAQVTVGSISVQSVVSAPFYEMMCTREMLAHTVLSYIIGEVKAAANETKAADR